MSVETMIPLTELKREIKIAPSILGGDQSNLAGALDIAVKGKGVGIVISPWNFPIAIPCGGMLAALAAGTMPLSAS